MGATTLEEMIVVYKADLSNLSSGIQKAKEQIGSVETKAKETSSSFLASIGGMGKSVLDFGSKLGIGIFGIKNLADTATGLAGAMLEPNAAMEQTQVAFTQLLGSSKAAGDYLQQLNQFAASTPFQFPDLAHASQLMLAFGYSAKDAKPMLTTLGDALSAMGKTDADSLSQITTVFGQMHAAGKVQAQDMLQLTSIGIPGWQILADKMHLSVGQVQQLSSEGKLLSKDTIPMLLSGMEKSFGGGMQKQAETFAGKLSTVKDNVGMAWRSFSGPAFDAAKQALGRILDLVSSPSFQLFATGAGKAIASIFEKIGGVIGPVAEGIGKFAGWIQQGSAPAAAVGIALGAIAAGFAAIQIGAFIATIPALVAGFFAWAGSAAAAAVATIAATWPLFAIGVAVALVVGGIILAVKHWGAIMGWISGVVHTVGGAIGGFFSGLGSKVHGIITGIGGAFSGLGSTVHGVWSGIVGSIKWAINIVIDLINGFIRGVDSIGIDLGPVHIHPNIPTIPHFATGGLTWGGAILVGERGPEILSPPAGSMVSPLTGGASSFSGGRVVNVHLHVEMDKREMAYALLNDISQLQAQHVRLKTGLKR